jgi:hypothetical protein
VEGRGQGEGGEMTQTLYAHMNKRKNKVKGNKYTFVMPFGFCSFIEVGRKKALQII